MAPEASEVMVVPDRSVADVPVLHLHGELTSESGASLPVQVADLLDDDVTPPRAVVLDANSVAFVDSAGVEVLQRVRDDVVGTGARMLLVCGAGAARRLLELCEVDASFECFDDLDAALAAAR